MFLQRSFSLLSLALVLTGSAFGQKNEQETNKTHIVQPGESIQAALDSLACQPGDTILVKGGVYAENIVIDKPGIHLKGRFGATINGRQVQSGKVPENFLPCVHVRADDVHVSGFRLFNGGFGILAADEPTTDPFNPLGPPVHRLRVRNNTMQGSAFEGVHVRGDDAFIRGNTFRRPGRQAIRILAETSSSYTTIRDNDFGLVHENCIELYDGAYEIRGNQAQRLEERFVYAEWGALTLTPPALSIFADNVVTKTDGNLFGLNISTTDGVSMLIENNFKQGGGDGVNIQEGGSGTITIRGNEFRDITSDGIEVSGEDATYIIENNTLVDCLDTGITVRGANATITGNTVTGSVGSGIGLVPQDAEEVSYITNFVIMNNISNENGTNGIYVVGSGNTISGNTCNGNFGDGIDLDNPDPFQGSSTGNVISGNACANNSHEGIDNSGVATAMNNNACSGNGDAGTTDIAGTGNGGVGSVSSFLGNVFDTGGEETPAILDYLFEENL